MADHVKNQGDHSHLHIKKASEEINQAHTLILNSHLSEDEKVSVVLSCLMCGTLEVLETNMGGCKLSLHLQPHVTTRLTIVSRSPSLSSMVWSLIGA